MTDTYLAQVEDRVRTIAGASILAHALIDVLRREARAIAAMTFDAPTGFIEAKERLIAAYAVKMQEVLALPEIPETMAALEELNMLNAEVLVSARRNAAQLQGAMDGNRMVLATIARNGSPAACLSPVAGHC
ncbi:MAG: hypothetical protein WCJ64_01025 [Rhodospirillaceae bacterium]